MVLFNYSTKELTAKVVYYGPGLCGKTTNLQYVHANLPGTIKGKMLSLATKTDRTLFFDFLPLDLGTIRGMKTRIQLYTVPGQVFYNETRKLVLKGADGIVFVADSQEQMLQANGESFRNLEENLKAHGMTLGEMPHVLQFNKRDLPKIASIEDMNAAINKFNAPFYETVATTGIGVQDTLKAITKLVLLHLTTKYDPKANARRAADATPTLTVPLPSVPAANGAGGIPLSAPDAMQRAATFARPSSIDLALEPSAAAGPPPPPNFHGTDMAEDGTEAPRFDDDEIEDLMDEVGDPAAAVERAAVPAQAEPLLHPFPMPAIDADNHFAPVDSVADFGDATIEMPSADVTMGATPNVEDTSPTVVVTEDEPWSADDEEPPRETTPTATIELPDVDPIQLAEPSDEEVDEESWTDDAVEPFPSIPARSGADLDHASVPLAADGGPERPAFELDSSFDPEWRTERFGDGLQTMRPGSADGPPPLTFDPPEDRDAPTAEFDAGDDHADDVPLELTEVAEDDRSLFDDPTLDVARLAAGHAKEIVVPVELGDGTEMRRFKLSVTLRLDPVD